MDRACTGREGRVRLCEHLAIGWDAIVEAARDLEKQPPLITNDECSTILLKCKESSHLPTHHQAAERDYPCLEW